MKYIRIATGIIILCLFSMQARAQMQADAAGKVREDTSETITPVLPYLEGIIDSSQIDIDLSNLPDGALLQIGNLNFRGLDIRDLMRGIGREYDLNLIVDNNINKRATIRLSDIPVIEAVIYICQEYSLKLVQMGQVFRIQNYNPPQKEPEPVIPDISLGKDGLLTFDLKGEDLEIVMRTLSRKTGENIVIRNGVSGSVNGFLQDVSFEVGLETILANNGFTMREKDGIYIIDRAGMRLRLESFTEISDESEDPTYNFDYIDSSDGVSLPAYGSFAKDFWGYYNGAESNTSSLPDVPELGESGANRQPDPVAIQAGLLEKITYPTGGYTELTYEPHDYGRIGSEWISEEEVQENVVQRYEDVSFYITAFELYGGEGHIYASEWLEKDFTVQSEDNQELVDINVYWPTDNVATIYSADVQIYDADDGSFVTSFSYNYAGSPNDSESQTIDVTPGTYTVKMRGISVCDAGCDVTWGNLYYVGFQVNLNWSETHLDTTINDISRTGGGVRVQSIRTNSGLSSSPAQVRRFSYRLGSDSNRSSGVILQEPVTYYQIPTPNSNCLFTQRSSSSYVPLGSLGGRVIGYSEVHVSYGENGQDGKKVFRYSNAGDIPDINYTQNAGAAFHRASTSNEWRRGHLLKSETYADNDALIRKRSNQYDSKLQGLSLIDGSFSSDFDINEANLHPLVSVVRATSITYPVTFEVKDNQGNPITITYAIQNPYYLIAGWHYPKEEKVTIYYSSTGDYQFSQTTYLYEASASSPALGQLRQKEESTSDEKKRITEYRYAHEVTDDGTGVNYSPMEGLHMLSQPYSVTVKDDSGTVLSKHWTLWSDSTGWWRPRGQWQWEGGNPGAPVFNTNN